MLKEKDMQKSVEEKLSDEALEQVAGGQIELVEDESTSKRTTVRRVNTDPLSRGDYQA